MLQRLTCLRLASRSSEVEVLQEMGLEHGATSNAKFSGPELEAGADDPRVLRRGQGVTRRGNAGHLFFASAAVQNHKFPPASPLCH
jgi:hypothetical protein